MVLYDPMEQPLLQIVQSHPATDKKLFLRRAPPWAGDISKLSVAQLRSCQAFAQFGINRLRGETGTVSMNGNTVSRTAQIVAEEYNNTGTGAFGGDPQRRQQMKEAQAQRNLERLEQELQRKNASTGAARVRGEPMTDGGVDGE